MKISSLATGLIASAAALALVPAMAQAAPSASISCASSPDVGAPSTAGGLFGTAPLTFPAPLVAGWDLGSGFSRGAETTASARYSPGGHVMNLVEVGRLRITQNDHDTMGMATLFSLCRFPDATLAADKSRSATDRKAVPIQIGGVKGTRLDLNINSAADPAKNKAPETDWFTIIALDTTPPSYFLGGSNKNNADARGKVDAVMRELRVR